MSLRFIRNRKKLIITAVVLTAIVSPLATSAIQNIFIQGDRIVDIQLGSTPINKVYLANQLIWERNAPAYMQDLTESDCASLSTGTILNLQDRRDDTYYRVKKMPDGNCWMVDNLALDLTSEYGGKPSWGTAPQIISGDEDIMETSIPHIALNILPGDRGEIPNNGSPKNTYLYNWCAAVADISVECAASQNVGAYGTVINGAVAEGSITTQSPSIGICPAPFRLPKGGPQATSSNPASTANEFSKLDIALGGNGANTDGIPDQLAIWLDASSGPNGWLGVYSSAFTIGIRTNLMGLWWTSTITDFTSRAYSLELSANLNLNRVSTASAQYTDRGQAIRCVLPSPPPPPPPSMQDFTPALCEAATPGEIIVLRDTRDGTFYRVKKMADNNCWMIDNLALDLTSNYPGKPAWLTAPRIVPELTYMTDTSPQIAQHTFPGDRGEIPNNGYPKKTYLYNWCAALADTSASCNSSFNATNFSTVIDGAINTSGTATYQPENTGICPAPFRLPKGGPNATSSDPATSASEFIKLDIAIGGTGTEVAGDTEHYARWMGTSPGPNTWHGVFSMYFLNGIPTMLASDQGNWWTSTASYYDNEAYAVRITDASKNVRPAYHRQDRALGISVRCLISP